jgi:hypothetical protein
MTLRAGRKAFLVLVALVVFATTVCAQSGRRSTARPTPPQPSTPPVSETAPVESTTKKAPAIELLVGIEDSSPLSGVPTYFTDTVLTVCVHRLSEPAGVHVTAGPRSLSRSEANKAAKAETVRYVVWLQVGNSNADSGRAATSSADEYYVNYMVLEPGTAKIKSSGHVYGARKTGNVGIGTPSARNAVYLEMVIKDEARQAADRILDALGIKETGLPRG